MWVCDSRRMEEQYLRDPNSDIVLLQGGHVTADIRRRVQRNSYSASASSLDLQRIRRATWVWQYNDHHYHPVPEDVSAHLDSVLGVASKPGLSIQTKLMELDVGEVRMCLKINSLKHTVTILVYMF